MTTSQWVFIEPPRYCRISDWGMPSRLDERRDFAFLSHSGRVWAVVLLNEVGMNPDFFKSQLRWLGDSYRLYLRDTTDLELKHMLPSNIHCSNSFHCTEIIVLHSPNFLASFAVRCTSPPPSFVARHHLCRLLHIVDRHLPHRPTRKTRPQPPPLSAAATMPDLGGSCGLVTSLVNIHGEYGTTNYSW